MKAIKTKMKQVHTPVIQTNHYSSGTEIIICYNSQIKKIWFPKEPKGQ